MAMRVSIDDMSAEISVSISVPGGYNPDCVHDLKARAFELFRDALAEKMTYAGVFKDADADPVETEAGQ